MMPPSLEHAWLSLWERLAHHFGGGWPTQDVHEPTRPAAESPEALHRQLDALEARIAARRMRVLETEAAKPKEHR